MSEGSVKNSTSNILSKVGARDKNRAVLRGVVFLASDYARWISGEPIIVAGGE